MLLIGTWNFKSYNNAILVMYKAYSYFIFWHYVVMTQLVMVSIPIQWDCKIRVIELICFYIQYTNNIIMMVLSKYSNKMQKVFDHILDYEDVKMRSTTNVEQKIYFKYAKLNKRVSLFVTAILLGTSVYWYTTSVRYSLFGQPTDVCPLTKGTIYQIWLPSIIRKYHWLMIVNDIVFFISVINITLYREIIMFAISIFMLGQIKILQQNVRDLEKTSEEVRNSRNVSYDDALLISVVKCAKEHQQVTKLMEIVQSATSIFILVLYFSNTFEMAAYLFQLISEKSIYNILRPLYVFTLMVSQLYIFYNYTNEILVESTALCDVIYNETNWIDYNQVIKKNLLLMMRRSQKQLSFKAAGLGDMSLQTFTNV
uniref:Odorant receptor n=1 Tax=Anoplophora chinensis TaxID=217632 RepID=A0A2H4ZBB6_ANOCN|nr:odorant receptor [Anoplophora chinensis]